jgi:hypothetical protein
MLSESTHRQANHDDLIDLALQNRAALVQFRFNVVELSAPPQRHQSAAMNR